MRGTRSRIPPRWSPRGSSGAGAVPDSSGKSSGGSVGGNLLKQVVQAGNVRRLLRAGSNALDWRERYFDHFSKVPQANWSEAFARALVRFEGRRASDVPRWPRSSHRRSEPADKLLHWESRTYLPGLFQQDDRMSMANSLESRVPIADPRVVDFAFRTPFSLEVPGRRIEMGSPPGRVGRDSGSRAQSTQGRVRYAGGSVDARRSPRLRQRPAPVIARSKPRLDASRGGRRPALPTGAAHVVRPRLEARLSGVLGPDLPGWRTSGGYGFDNGAASCGVTSFRN